MKPLHNYLRTGAVIAGLLGATAVPAVAASPALAVDAYGSGAAAQKALQSTWITNSGASVTYTPTTSGAGQAEFGLGSSAFDTTQDPTANAVGALDGYVAVDNPPSAEEQSHADTAAGITTTSLLTDPVAQASEVIELNVPAGITLNSAQNIDLTNVLAEQLFSGNVPANSPYLANTWGALLKDSGLTVTTSAPSVGQFKDDGTNGGTTAIKLVLRADGAGTTLNIKQYLNYINSTDFPTGKIDENTTASGEWPSGATISSRQSSDSAQANAVSATAGLVGYGTLSAALAATPSAFAASPGTGGTHTLFAFLQDNGVNPVTPAPRFADPELSSGQSNVYTGTNVNTGSTYAPGSQTGAGLWLVPVNGKGQLNTTGVWGKDVTEPSDYTHSWDVDVYDDAGALTDYYPLGFVFWDLSWDHPAWGNGLLTKPYYNPPATVEAATKKLLVYATTLATGQADTVALHYAPLPNGGSGTANIQADALAIANSL